MTSCLVCLRPVRGDGVTHARCEKELFGRRSRPVLEVDPSELERLGLEMAGRVSVSGVQEKLALSLEGDRLRLATRSGAARFLLKLRSSLPELPENEHLTMLIARALGLETATVGLFALSDGSRALLVRRFDRTDDGRRVPMEDFCQLAEVPPADKYNGSIETCVKLVRTYSSQPRVDLLELFRRVLVSWLLGNGDLHLKNLSLLTVGGRARFSPVYDVVNTTLVIPDDTMALTLCGKRARFRSRDWLDLAQRCDVPPEVVMREVARIVRAGGEMARLVEASYLSSDRKLDYLRGVTDRLHALVDLFESARAVSTKASSRRAAPVPLSRTEMARTASLLEGELEDAGLAIGDTPLAAELDALEWLSGGDADVFDPGGAYEREPDRARDAIQRFVRLDRVRKSLEIAARFRGFEHVVQHLKRLSGADPDGQSWDHLFEIELAAQLASRDWDLRFEEHGVLLVDASGGELAWECKRPRESSTVVRNVKKALEQIVRAKRAGVVAVSLDLILDRALEYDEPEDLRAASDRAMDAVLAPLRSDIEGLLPERPAGDESLAGPVLGVLFTATFLVLGRDPNGGAFVNTRFHVRAVPNPNDPRSGFLSFFEDRLAIGQQELRMRS